MWLSFYLHGQPSFWNEGLMGHEKVDQIISLWPGPMQRGGGVIFYSYMICLREKESGFYDSH